VSVLLHHFARVVGKGQEAWIVVKKITNFRRRPPSATVINGYYSQTGPKQIIHLLSQTTFKDGCFFLGTDGNREHNFLGLGG